MAIWCIIFLWQFGMKKRPEFIHIELTDRNLNLEIFFGIWAPNLKLFWRENSNKNPESFTLSELTRAGKRLKMILNLESMFIAQK